MNPRTLGEVLSRARGASEDIGLVLVDRREREEFASWREIGEQSERLAQALMARGVGRGDRVLLALPSSREFAVAFFGAVLAGAAPAPCPPPPPFARIDETRDRLERRRAALDARWVLDERSVRSLLEESPSEPPRAFPEITAEDLALVQYSSGTTSCATSC